MIKNCTYRNIMIVIHKIQKKGYTFEESEKMARRIFADFAARPQGMSIERMTEAILTKEEWENECNNA